MYVPSAFAQSDLDRLFDFIEAHSFGTLVSVIDGVPFASHVPFLLDRPRQRLVGHLARANPHWRGFDPAVSLAIFTGPHGYISPTWYTTGPTVPTWNFSAVHVTAKVHLVQDGPALGDIVDRLSRHFERDDAPVWLEQMPEKYRQGLLGGIVGFEMPITRIEGKFKMSQNRSLADREAVIARLESLVDAEAQNLAGMMRACLPAPRE